MTATSIAEGTTWAIAAVTTGGIIARPWRLPEAVWAVLGAAALVASSLVPWPEAAGAIGRGTDVYLFLAGMMLLAELARQEGVFDWFAALAAGAAHGSPVRLFSLLFGVATLVTVFLSNDATAVVLTPAVYAAARTAKAKPLPYLFICAFVANAASFVLPISNPANLVVFGTRMPALGAWLAGFALPASLAIASTYLALRFTQASALKEKIAGVIDVPALSKAGRTTACGLAASAAILLLASALNLRLGLPTFAAGTLTAATVLFAKRRAPWDLLRHISWSVIPLVAGLFVLVEGLVRTGVVPELAEAAQTAARHAPIAASWAAGGIAGLASNLMNNLPVGLIAGSILASGPTDPHVASALLIGVDLGPNLSVTGSLATILWLVALRREGINVSAWDFLRLGAILTIPALALALAAALLVPVQ